MTCILYHVIVRDIIGASLSKPHTYVKLGNFVLLLDECRALWGEPAESIAQQQSWLPKGIMYGFSLQNMESIDGVPPPQDTY